MVANRLPDLAMITLTLRVSKSWDAELIQRNPLRIEHAEDIVIGDDQQIDRAAELIVGIGKQARIDMTVWAN